MDAFVFLKMLTAAALPPASMIVGLIAALILGALRLRRLGLVVGLAAIGEMLALSLPPVADALFVPLQNEARAAAAQAPACCYDAIVVLGGGVIPAAPPIQNEPDLADAADRVWEAARLYRRKIAHQIIVSGGNFVEQTGGLGTSEADAMRQFLVDLGVPPEAIVMEGASLNTIENIRNVRRLAGGGRVALVTSAYHMPRALRLARQAKLDVGAFPTDWRAPAELRAPWNNWMPSATAMYWASVALHEYLALLFDRRV